jgi:hypothetical protein
MSRRTYTNTNSHKPIPTTKQWIDEDGDHVTISSDIELKEAFTGSPPSRTFVVFLPEMDSESIQKIVAFSGEGEDWVIVKPEDCEPQSDTPPGPAAAQANEDVPPAPELVNAPKAEHKEEDRAREQQSQRRDSNAEMKSVNRRSPALQTKMADAGECFFCRAFYFCGKGMGGGSLDCHCVMSRFVVSTCKFIIWVFSLFADNGYISEMHSY